MGDLFLVSYDVRSIQSYIYSTSKVKEIMGASFIVRDFLLDSIKDICEENHFSYDLDTKDDFEFQDSLIFQIAFVGGGNLLAFIKGVDNVHLINRQLSKRFLEKTYSLSISFAYAKITSNFVQDLMNVKAKLSEVKKRMPASNYQPGLPITANNPFTGLPFSKKMKNVGVINKYTKEAAFKLETFENKDPQNSEFNNIKEFDELTEKGTDSYLGFIHIDGNSFGEMITAFHRNAENNLKNKENGLTEKQAYEASVNRSRFISKTIQENFSNVIFQVFKELNIPHRLVIDSGDDVTLVVKDADAFPVVKNFLYKIKQNSLGEKHFSACAGIAFAKSHFPFDKAYKIAEACCEKAKTMVKDLNRPNKNTVECALDYYICSGGNADSVEEKEEMFKNLYEKPYFVGRGSMEPNDLEKLEEKIAFLSNNGSAENDVNIARSAAKEIRSVYEQGELATRIKFHMVNSRLKDQKLSEPFETVETFSGIKKAATYYDASCLLDLYKTEEGE